MALYAAAFWRPNMASHFNSQQKPSRRQSSGWKKMGGSATLKCWQSWLKRSEHQVVNC